nr:hypothetical protein [uncultured Friedmanniella sp.]
MTTLAGRNRALLLAGALLGLQALAVLGFAAFEVPRIRPASAAAGIAVVAMIAGYGVLLAILARAVARARRWSRGLAVVTQLVLLLLAYSVRQPPTTWAGLVMGLVALTVLGCLLAPASTRAFLGQDLPTS